MMAFSIGTNRTIGTDGPSELPCTQLDHMENNLSPLMKCIFTNRTILSRVYLKRRISANICFQICLS